MSQAYRQCMTLSAFDYAWAIVGRKGVWDRETSLCKPVFNGLICIIAEEKAKKARSMVPMSREQYEAEQSVIREVYDEESGRYRLVRGSGEIIERIVSQGEHSRINQTATRGDGASFARNIFGASRRR